MNRRNLAASLSVITLASSLFLGCGEDVYDVPWFSAGIGASLYGEGEAVAGASRMLHFSYRSGADLYEPVLMEVKGRLRASRVDWLNNKCGTIVHWELRGDDAWEAMLDFYRDFPLTSDDDVNAFMENALLPVLLEPGEMPPQPSGDEPSEPEWKFTFDLPYEPLAETLIEEGHQDVVGAAEALEQATQGVAIWYRVADATEGSKAAELFHYIEDFGDRQLRAYLERENPKCLVR